METFGGGLSSLSALLSNPDSPCLRVSSETLCPVCGCRQREPSALSLMPPFVSLDTREIKAAGNDPFAALSTKLNTVTSHLRVTKCISCQKQEPHDVHCIINDAARAIMLELPGSPPPRTYSLRATEARELNVDGRSLGMYRLVGVLLYKAGAHFIAEVLDHRTRDWIRYDAYGATKGRGQRVEPPAGRVQHTHGLRGSYFPISLIYVQVPPELHEESTGS